MKLNMNRNPKSTFNPRSPNNQKQNVVSIFMVNVQRCARAVKKFILHLNEDTIFGIWMAVIFLAGVLVWGLTAAPRLSRMANEVNRVLAEAGDTRSLSEPLSPWQLPGPASASASWYMTSSREIAAVFPLFYEGVFSPCLAIFGADGKIDSFLPLSRQARLAAGRAEDGMAALQKERIEKAARLIIRKTNGGGQ